MSGYRVAGPNRAAIAELRARLGELEGDQWVKAGCIMDEIVWLAGYSGGPMGGKVNPRVCKYCDHYGHTRQHCPVMKAERELRESYWAKEVTAEDEALRERHAYQEQDQSWLDWLAWVGERNSALHALGAPCEFASPACNECQECQKQDAFLRDWDSEHPEPGRT